MRVYKKSLMVQLVKLGHELDHTERNRNNPKHQIYFFPDSEQIEKDLAMLTGKEYVKRT